MFNTKKLWLWVCNKNFVVTAQQNYIFNAHLAVHNSETMTKNVK